MLLCLSKDHDAVFLRIYDTFVNVGIWDMLGFSVDDTFGVLVTEPIANLL